MMKKALLIFTIFIVIIGMFFATTKIYAAEKAIDEGYNVIVMPGYAFAPTIQEVAGKNPNVKFIALDVSKGDFAADYELPSNVYCAVRISWLHGWLRCC